MMFAPDGKAADTPTAATADAPPHCPAKAYIADAEFGTCYDTELIGRFEISC